MTERRTSQNPNDKFEKAWVIQRCINAWKALYEDGPGYCESPNELEEMMQALKECDERCG